MANSELEFVGLSGETITKEPGSINGHVSSSPIWNRTLKDWDTEVLSGRHRDSIPAHMKLGDQVVARRNAPGLESVTLRDLQACTVYLLDYTSEVEVTNVSNCQIFIGPVDGPAIFENVVDSRIAVVAQQFQAKSVSDSEFDLFSATQPTLNNCSGVRIGCWRGAYPGLSQHFQQASLDPHSNQWSKAKDISTVDSATATFRLVDDVQPWEVPIEGAALPENPVPFASTPTEHSSFGFGSSPVLGNGHAADFTEPQVEHPKLAAITAQLRERQEAQEAREKEVKTELVQKAASFLEDFYKKRSSRVEQKAKRNRETEQTLTISGPEGDTEWEKAVNLINFNFTRPSGTDLSRFKNVLFSAKSKNVPIKAGKATV